METYTRVIPRDFYNESKLLKCLGYLKIKSEQHDRPDGIEISIEENGERFLIEKDESSGDIYVANYGTSVNGKAVRFATNLNSKSNFPLYCEYEDTPYGIFDDNGNWDEEFINAFQNINPAQ